ncbi:MAG: cytochrome b/b6 domain-containing protein [Lentimicrobium sp.]|jgi:thiosulfate reductase cytochrome b subunit|nr:cytochrome b/b6 domain-containing protein [Lentimicrobium sp.]
MPNKRIYLYPVWIRLWHTINAILMVMLILSGLSMQYSNPNYPLIRFDLAVKMHNISGILITVFFLYFLLAIIFNWAGKFYRMPLKGYSKRLLKQVKYYMFGIFRGEKAYFPVNEERKFNPIQLLSYNLIQFVAVPLVIITGWALLFPETIVLNFFGYSGILLTSLLHVIMGFFISIFLIIHLYFITVGHSVTSNLKSIVTGYHDIDEEDSVATQTENSTTLQNNDTHKT